MGADLDKAFRDLPPDIREVYSLVKQSHDEIMLSLEATRQRHHQSMNDITVQLAKLSIRIEDLSAASLRMEGVIATKADLSTVQALAQRISFFDSQEPYRADLFNRFKATEGDVESLKLTKAETGAVTIYRKWLIGLGVALCGALGSVVWTLVTLAGKR